MIHAPEKQLRLVDRLSDVVVVNCEALRRHLITKHSVNPARIELCYNGVETKGVLSCSGGEACGGC